VPVAPLLKVARAPDTFDRIEAFAARRGPDWRGWNPAVLLVRCWRRSIDVRITGLAAEMTYYALISLIPLITAVGATLGFAERILGSEQVQRMEDAVVGALGVVFEAQLTEEVLAPLVRGLLREERAGVAVGGLLVALWLASRMFRAAIRALDDAYQVPERRGLVTQWGLGLLLSLGAVVTFVVVLVVLVMGPLLGLGTRLAEEVGQEDTAATVWAALRWPVVVVVCVVFLVVLYRHAPNVRNRIRDCLPGAVAGTAALVAVALGFRAYLATVGAGGPDVGASGEAVAVAGQVIGVVLAGVLWLWLSSIVILGGGVLNAEVSRMRQEADEE
jgi:membrane protein